MDNRSNQGQLTFSKEERITHKGDIEKLFISGKKLSQIDVKEALQWVK